MRDPAASRRFHHSHPSGHRSLNGCVCCTGGLEESVNEVTLRAAFVPFGEIVDVNMPMEGNAQKHKGFAFVQFDDPSDAAEAIDNMHNAELFGRVLRVNLSKPDVMKGGHRPVWESRADDFFKRDEEGADAAS